MLTQKQTKNSPSFDEIKYGSISRFCDIRFIVILITVIWGGRMIRISYHIAGGNLRQQPYTTGDARTWIHFAQRSGNDLFYTVAKF